MKTTPPKNDIPVIPTHLLQLFKMLKKDEQQKKQANMVVENPLFKILKK